MLKTFSRIVFYTNSVLSWCKDEIIFLVLFSVYSIFPLLLSFSQTLFLTNSFVSEIWKFYMSLIRNRKKIQNW